MNNLSVLQSFSKTGLKCLHPRIVRQPNWLADGTLNPNGGEKMFVPCGKCYNCLSARRQQWLFRLVAESLNSSYSFFLTLTSDDEHYNDICVFNGDIESFEVSKSVLQKYFKRLRKRGLNYKYYAIGEFGTRTLRAHYHAVIFVKNSIGVRSDVHNIVGTEWPYGNIYFGSFTPASANYVLHYHVRPKIKTTYLYDYKSFSVCSQGLGISFFTPEILRYYEKSKDYQVRTKDGQIGILPRYYRKKFDLPLKEFTFQPKRFTEMPAIDENAQYDYIFDLRHLDNEKLNKYNEQDKF